MKKVLQLGKFYPIKGGVEKVMYDLMSGLSQRGVYCDMLCAVRDRSKHVNLKFVMLKQVCKSHLLLRMDSNICHNDIPGYDLEIEKDKFQV